MKNCKLCSSMDPFVLHIEKQFLAGSINIREAEKLLSVRHETAFTHFTQHVTPSYIQHKEQLINQRDKESSANELDFYTKRLDRILTILERRIDMLPFREGNEKALSSLIRELRETLKLYAELSGKLQSISQTNINVNLEVTMQKLQRIEQLILKYGTPKLRQLVAETLETESLETEPLERTEEETK